MYKYLLQQEASLFVSWLLSSMKVTTVSILFLVICCGQSTAQLSTAEKQQALDFHNDLRRSEGASNMQCMVTALCNIPLELYMHVLNMRIKTHLWNLSTNLSKLNIVLKLKNIVLYES